MLTAEQKTQIQKQGMDLTLVEEQITNFRDGFPFLHIHTPAAIGDGIRVLNEKTLEAALGTYKEYSPQKSIVKFVPASGAASRMFKDLFGFLESGHNDLEKDTFTKKFIEQLGGFAFYEDLDNSLKKSGSSIEHAIADQNYQLIVHHLLDEEGLEYGTLPKGLLKFHAYRDGSRTPVQEHFVEGAQYGLGHGKVVQLHFTVSPEHQEKFETHIAKVKPKMERHFGVNFEISFSQQKTSTNTIAVDTDNNPFVEEDGEILFRPAGHGALLENLNDIDGDIIFIKNIDNVVPDRLKEPTVRFKRAIGGLLLDVQKAVFRSLESLDNEISDFSVQDAIEVYTKKVGSKLPDGFESRTLEEQATFLRNKLNRPIRVCGMVENTGEPGGGPFWVKEPDGSLSLQIGETAQLDLDNPEQKEKFKKSSHFNPTDLVCGVRDYKGNKFNLLKHRDPKTGFITEKSKSGRALKAQELPGLWNGSMSDWNSIFVEVPLITFNPVKTINDLLRDVHQ